jgi:glycosyltransferase involved in cell wall biosynthesis
VKVSVIIATYNWSSVLRCSIASALLQTFTDFELLVIGDGCTDDSEQAVRSFNDSRIQWVNLPANSGNQVAPNNHGLSIARGDYIAYLGHDDLWYPTHLESLVATIEAQDADVAGAVTIMYGPPGSDAYALSGILVRDRFEPDDFMVPSSILHRRSLVEKIGFWKNASEISSPTDCEFLKRAFDNGASIVTTNEVSVFKFNAAWRKGAYRSRRSDEQQAMLDRIRSGVDFRQAEMVAVIRSIFEDRFCRVKAPDPSLYKPGEISRHNATIKGTAKQEIRNLTPADGPVRFDLSSQTQTFDWHGLETHEEMTCRWSGPSRVSHLEFPVRIDVPFTVRVFVPNHFQQDLGADVQLSVNDTPVAHELNSSILTAQAPAMKEAPLTVTIRVKRTVRPVDLKLNQDPRWLGVAVAWLEFEVDAF